MLDAITALHDATRVLRSGGAGRKGDSAADGERTALFEFAAITDRLTAFADDQGADDWNDFWVTQREVDVLRSNTSALARSPRGLAASTLPALSLLIDDLEPLAMPHES